MQCGLAAMNLDEPLHDVRLIEVVCNGTLWHGAQLADATIDFGQPGYARRAAETCGADARPSAAVQNATRCKHAKAAANLPGA